MADDKDAAYEIDEDTLRALIRDTVGGLGEVAPDTLPHRVRERLKGQLAAHPDIDRILRDILKET
ncbi:hypothetical protein PB2503_09329 [Parvularcula bermudensis HTCC2503]|uniref:Uncharacterized protein n=1 Tax=Parvularcula bermudensis (strain ATCC BAA-594 / HTCC2503 / KCTC 12087) TaxID=314260 RepID=E0TD96_PARBH|nr:hypothetical protein [Parvularcula bermudensis]ADM09919.1 hypothetical protein PB2503_09329 [Parvularcula bermudensis HTCC2503]